MKKVLLSTTAIVAAGLLVTSVAYAADEEMMAEPVSIGIGGYTTGAMGFASDGDDGMRSHSIDYVFEVGFSGSTTLDNGITVGVSGQIGRSAGGDEAMDEIHTTLSGSFGSLRLGRTESAAFNSTVAAPGAGIGGMLGVNYSWFSTAAKAVNTYSGLGEEDAMKVVYTTPNFNGLTLGASYAPNNTAESFSSRSTAGLGEHTAVGATYSLDFMDGGSVTLGAGYEVASGSGDPSAMRAGINVALDQISFGGSMYDDSDTPTEGMAFDVGASWTEGPMEIGLQYAVDENTVVRTAVPGEGHRHDAAGMEIPNMGMDAVNGETSKLALHLTYTLGPGVLIGGQIAAGTFEGMDDVTQFMLGTAVFF